MDVKKEMNVEEIILQGNIKEEQCFQRQCFPKQSSIEFEILHESPNKLRLKGRGFLEKMVDN